MKGFYQEFKTPIVTIVLVLLGFFIYTKIAGPIPFYINSVTTTKTDLFTANGDGEATAVPDSATVSVGITEQATTVSEAQNKTNALASKVLESVKKLGISEKDIKTTNYSVTPNYGSNPVRPVQSSGAAEPLLYEIPPSQGSEQPIVGYTVTQNLEIKVKPIDKVNSVVDAATAAGANLVGGVNFTFSDDLQKSLEDTARKDAVADAKKRAQSLAEASGVRLGRIINVVESSNGYPQPYMMRDAVASKAEGTPTDITPGEGSVVINVVIYYEIY